MRLLIDMQGYQLSRSGHQIRDIVDILIKNFLNQYKEDEIILLLSDSFPESIEFIRALFPELNNSKNIFIYRSIKNIKAQTGDREKRYAMELIREGVINKIRPDIVFVTSLFDGRDKDAVISMDSLHENIPSAVLIKSLDFIVNKHLYLENYKVREWYFNQLSYLYKAELIFTVSDNDRDILIDNHKDISEKIFSLKDINKSENNFSPIELEQSVAEIRERLLSIICQKNSVKTERPIRKRLVFVSPLPPIKSGISKYSAELLPELLNYYDIDVIVNQPMISDSWINENCRIHDIDWFREHSFQYDRVLYHFGNSEFHSHMVQLLSDIPGIVVMHDYYLSGLISYTDIASSGETSHWPLALLNSHGWKAVHEFYTSSGKNNHDLAFKYPSNQQILQQALGIIVHSNYSKRMADNYYGYEVSGNWAQIPLLKAQTKKNDKETAREILNISHDAFIVCSFGLLGSTKLNDRLLSAWLASPMANNSNCYLVFVGEAVSCQYNNELIDKIDLSNTKSHIIITGWVSDEAYSDWASAADIGVQLRAMSLGETSAAVLDCMNYGLATIVNANGSMADLPQDAVYKLQDNFTDDELVQALTKLYEDKNYRQNLSFNASNIIHSQHQPEYCAKKYYQEIERFYNEVDSQPLGIIKRLAEKSLSYESLVDISKCISSNFPLSPRRKQLFLDITVLNLTDGKTGIQRVVKAILKQLLLNPPDNFDVQPVYICPDGLGYRYARKFTCNFLNIKNNWVDDELVEFDSRDIFLGLDLNIAYISEAEQALTVFHQYGMKVYFIVYDLLPILLPDAFYEDMEPKYLQWIEMMVKFDGAICISKAVADELSQWLEDNYPDKKGRFKIDWFNLGADIDDAIPSLGVPEDAEALLQKLQEVPSFLMVGTIEPRKCHQQILRGFNELWNRDYDINLVIVGKRGWLTETLIKEIEHHPRLNSRLFWLEQCSDEYLEKIYAASTCLIAASKGEGFGLPVIEAIKHGLPVIARDIPVFREVTNESAFYFKGLEPSEAAQAIEDWLALYKQGNLPDPEQITWLTWEQSTNQLLNVVLNKFQNQ